MATPLDIQSSILQANINSQLAQQQLPNVNPQVLAFGMTNELSDEQKKVLSRDEYNALYNQNQFDLEHGAYTRANLEQIAQQYISPDLFKIDDRSRAERLWDIGLGIAQGVGQMGFGLASFGAGVLLPGSGAATEIARTSNALTEWSNQFGSSFRKAAQKGNASKQEVRNEFSLRQWKQNKANGDSDFIAGLKQIGADMLQGAKDWWNDPNQAEQTISNALGSLLMAGPLSKGVSLAGQALGRTASSSFVKKLASNMAGTTEGRNFAAKMFGNEGLTNALLEMGGSVQGAVASVDALTYDQLMSNPTFVEKVQEYMSKGNTQEIAFQKAKDELAGSVAKYAAFITAPIAAGAGVFASKVIRNPAGLDSWNPLYKVPLKLGQRGGEEAFEEWIQGTQKLGENLGMQQEGFDTHLWEGIGSEMAQGALAGGVSGGAGPIFGTAGKIPLNTAKQIYNITPFAQNQLINQQQKTIQNLSSQIQSNANLADDEKTAYQNLTDELNGKIKGNAEIWDIIKRLTNHEISEETQKEYDSSKTFLENQNSLIKKAKKLEKKDPEKAQHIYKDVLAMQQVITANQNNIQSSLGIQQDILQGVVENKKNPNPEKPSNSQKIVSALQLADPAEALEKVKEILSPAIEKNVPQKPSESSEDYTKRLNQDKNLYALNYLKTWEALTHKNSSQNNQSLADRAETLLPILQQISKSPLSTAQIQQANNLTVENRLQKLQKQAAMRQSKEELNKPVQPTEATVEKGSPNLEKPIEGTPDKSVVTPHTNPKQIESFVNDPSIPLSWNSDTTQANAKTYATGLSSDGKYVSFLAGNTWNSIPIEDFKKAKQAAQAQQTQQQSTTVTETSSKASEPSSQPVSEKPEANSKPEEKPSQIGSEQTKKVPSIETIHETKDTSKPLGSIQNPQAVKAEAQEKELKKLLIENASVKQYASDTKHILVEKDGQWYEYNTVIYNEVKNQINDNSLYRKTSSTSKKSSSEPDKNTNINALSEEWAKGTVVVFDIETTALTPREGEELNLDPGTVQPYQIHGEKYENGKLVGTLTRWIQLNEPNADGKPSSLISNIPDTVDGQANTTKATYAGQQKVSFKDAYNDFKEFVGDAALAGHYASHFDIEVLRNNAKIKLGNEEAAKLNNKVFDTRDIARTVYSDKDLDNDGYRLGNIVQKYSLPTPSEGQAHDAAYDVFMTVQVIKHMVERNAIDTIEEELKEYTPSGKKTEEDLLIEDLVNTALGKASATYTFEYDPKSNFIKVKKDNEVKYYFTLNSGIKTYGQLYKENDTVIKGFQSILLNNTQLKFIKQALHILEPRLKGITASTKQTTQELPEILKNGTDNLTMTPKDPKETPTYTSYFRGNTLITDAYNNLLFFKNSNNEWIDNRNTKNVGKKITDSKDIEFLDTLVEHLKGIKLSEAVHISEDYYSNIKVYSDGVVELLNINGKVALKRTQNGTWWSTEGAFAKPLSIELNEKVNQLYEKLQQTKPTEEFNVTKDETVSNKSLDLTSKDLSIDYGTFNTIILTDLSTGNTYRLQSMWGLPSYQWYITYTKNGKEKRIPATAEQNKQLTAELLRRTFNIHPTLLSIENLNMEITDHAESHGQQITIFDADDTSKTPIATLIYRNKKQNPKWTFDSALINSNMSEEQTRIASSIFGNILYSLLEPNAQSQANQKAKKLSLNNVDEDSLLRKGTSIHNITPGSIYAFLNHYLDNHTAADPFYKQVQELVFWMDQFSHNIDEFSDIIQEKLFNEKIFMLHENTAEDIAQLLTLAADDAIAQINGKPSNKLHDFIESKPDTISFSSEVDLNNITEEQFMSLMHTTSLGMLLERADLATFNVIFDAFKNIAQNEKYQTKVFKTVDAFYATLDEIAQEIFKNKTVQEVYKGTTEIIPGQSMFQGKVDLTNSALTEEAAASVIDALNFLFEHNSEKRDSNNLLNYLSDPIASLKNFFDMFVKGEISKEALVEMFTISNDKAGKHEANVRASALYDTLSEDSFRVAKAFAKFFNQSSRSSLLGRLMGQLQKDFLSARNQSEKEYQEEALSQSSGSEIIAALDAALKLNNANSTILLQTIDKNGNIVWNQKLLAKVALAALSAYFKVAKIATGHHDNNAHKEILLHHVDDSEQVVQRAMDVSGDIHIETVFSIFEAVKSDIRQYLDLHPSKNMSDEAYDNFLNSVTATMMQSMANLGLFTVVRAEYQGNSDQDINNIFISVDGKKLDGTAIHYEDGVKKYDPAKKDKQAYKSKIFISVNNALKPGNKPGSYADQDLYNLAGEIQQNASYFLGNFLLGLDQSGVFISMEQVNEHIKKQNDYYKHSHDKPTEEQLEERNKRQEQPSQINLPFFGLLRILKQDDETIHAIAQYFGDDFSENDYGIATDAYLRSQKGKWINLVTSFRNLEAIFNRIKADSENSADTPENQKKLADYRIYYAYMINIMGRFSMEEGAQAQQDKCWRQMFPVALKDGSTPSIDLNNSKDFENFIRAICQGLGVKVPRVLRGNEAFLYQQLDNQLFRQQENNETGPRQPLFTTKAWKAFCELVKTFPTNNTIGIDFSSTNAAEKETIINLLAELQNYGLDKSWLALDNLTELARLSNEYAKHHDGNGFNSFAELGSFYGLDETNTSYKWESNQVIENDGMNSGFSHIAHTLIPTIGNLTLQLLNVWHATGMAFANMEASADNPGSAANALMQSTFDEITDEASITNALYSGARDGYQMVANGAANIMNKILRDNIFVPGYWPTSLGNDSYATNTRDLNTGKRKMQRIDPMYLTNRIVSLISKLDKNFQFTANVEAGLTISRTGVKDPTMWFQYGAGLDTSAVKIVGHLIEIYQEKITEYNRLVHKNPSDPEIKNLFAEIKEIAELMRESSLVHISGRDSLNVVNARQNIRSENIHNFLPDVQEGQLIPSSFNLSATDFRILKDNFKYLLVQNITDYMNKELFGGQDVVQNKNAITSATQVLNNMYEAMQMAWIKKLLQDAGKEGPILEEQLNKIRKYIKDFLPTLENELKLNDHENNPVVLKKKLITMKQTMLRTLMDEHYQEFFTDADKRNLSNGRGLFQNRELTLMPSLSGQMNFDVRTGGGVAILIQAIQGLAEASIISAMTRSNPGLSFLDFYDGINFRLDQNTIKGTQLSNKYCYEIWTKLNVFESICKMLDHFNGIFLNPNEQQAISMDLASSIFSNCKTKIDEKTKKEVPALNGIQQNMCDALYTLGQITHILPETLSKAEFSKQIFTFENNAFQDSYKPGLFQKIMLNSQRFFAQQARNQAIQNRALRGIYPLVIDQLAGLGIGFRSEVEKLPEAIQEAIKDRVIKLAEYIQNGQYKAANELYVDIYNEVTLKLSELKEYSVDNYFTQNPEIFNKYIHGIESNKFILSETMRNAFAPVEELRNAEINESMEQVLHEQNRAGKAKIASLASTVSSWIRNLKGDSVEKRTLRSLVSFLHELAMIPSIANKYRILELDKEMFHDLSNEQKKEQISALISKQFPTLEKDDPKAYQQIVNKLLDTYTNASKLASTGGLFQSFNGSGLIVIFTNAKKENSTNEAERLEALRQKAISTIHEIGHAFTSDYFYKVLTLDPETGKLIVTKDAFNGDMKAYHLMQHFIDVFYEQMTEATEKLNADPTSLDHAPILKMLTQWYLDPENVSVKKCFNEFVTYALSEQHIMNMLGSKQIHVDDLGIAQAYTKLFNEKDNPESNSDWWQKFKNKVIKFANEVTKFVSDQLVKILGKKVLNDKQNINILNDMFWSLQELFKTESYTQFMENPESSNQTLYFASVETPSLREKFYVNDSQHKEGFSYIKNQQTQRNIRKGSEEIAKQLAEKAMLPSSTNNFASTNLTNIQAVASVFNFTTPEQIDTFNKYMSVFMRTYYLDRSQLKPFADIQFKIFEELTDMSFAPKDNPTQEEIASSTAKANLLRALLKDGINFPDLRNDLQVSYAMPVILALLEISPEMRQFTDSIAWNTPKEHERNNPNEWLRGLGYDLHHALHNIEVGLPNKNPTLYQVYKYRCKILDNIFAGNQESIFESLPSFVNSRLNSLEEKFQTFLLKNLSKMDLNKTRNIFMGSLMAPMLNIPHTFPVEMGRKALYFSDRTPKWLAEIGSEFLGYCRGDITFYEFRKHLKSKVDAVRQRYRTSMPKEIRKMFGKKISKHMWESLYRSLARTGIGTLVYLNENLITQIPALLTPQNVHIKKLEHIIGQNISQEVKKQILEKARQTAHYMVTGEAGSFLLKSSFAILQYTRANNSKVQRVDERDVDQLISLYALQELSEKDKQNLLKIYENFEEPTKRLIKYMAHLHQTEHEKIKQLEINLEKEPNNQILHQEYMRIKMNAFQNFIPVHRTDGTSMIVAEDSRQDELERMGYKRVGDYNNKFTQKMGYYYSPIPQQAEFMEGMIVITSPSYQGCYRNTGRAVQGVSHSSYITDKTVVDRITKALQEGKIDSDTADNLIPVWGGTYAPQVVGYEYALNPKQASFIENKTELPEMLGILHGRQEEEKIAAEINQAAIKIIIDTFDPDYHKMNMYVDLLDPKLNAIQKDAISRIPYELLDQMKKAFEAKGFGPHIYVRKDLFIDIIGERKISIAEVFDPKNSDMNAKALQSVANTLTFFFGKDAMRYAVYGEKALQGAVSWAKSTIVVRSCQVCIINMVANIFHLLASGVPLNIILAEIPLLISECEDYVKNQKKMRRLELLEYSASSEAEAKRYESQRLALQQANAKLGISDIIDEFSMITDLGRTSEEVALSKGHLGEWFQKKIDMLPDSVVATGNFLLMGKDTPIFEALEKATQYGDFIAKAILYRHWVRNNLKSPAEARARVLYEFVDYDKNAGRARNYLESIGLMWFMNYRLRIMRVAENLLKEHPIRAILTMALPNPVPFLGDAGDVFSDSVIGKIFQGLGMNALGFEMFWQALRLHPLAWILSGI